MSSNYKIRIGNTVFNNPVLTASGCCGYGKELKDYLQIGKLGGLVTKTITLKPRKGNAVPRIAETPSGMLNSIGLENDGLKDFVFNKVKFLETLKTNVIVSVSGFSVGEFVCVVGELSKFSFIKGFEINLSCPNVQHKVKQNKLFAQDGKQVEKIISAVRKRTKKMIFAKLTPNVTDIKDIAKSAEAAGADGLTVINTVFGMAIDADSQKPKLANVVGGLSGPAIKPIALYCVHEAYKAVKIPIIGCGGIMCAKDVLEFLLCGASLVQVGTANFINPSVCNEIVTDLERYMLKNKIKNIKSLRGKIHLLKKGEGVEKRP